MTENLKSTKAGDLIDLEVTVDENLKVAIINGYSLVQITETELWLQLDLKSRTSLS